MGMQIGRIQPGSDEMFQRGMAPGANMSQMLGNQAMQTLQLAQLAQTIAMNKHNQALEMKRLDIMEKQLENDKGFQEKQLALMTKQAEYNYSNDKDKITNELVAIVKGMAGTIRNAGISLGASPKTLSTVMEKNGVDQSLISNETPAGDMKANIRTFKDAMSDFLQYKGTSLTPEQQDAANAAMGNIKSSTQGIKAMLARMTPNDLKDPANAVMIESYKRQLDLANSLSNEWDSYMSGLSQAVESQNKSMANARNESARAGLKSKLSALGESTPPAERPWITGPEALIRSPIHQIYDRLPIGGQLKQAQGLKGDPLASVIGGQNAPFRSEQERQDVSLENVLNKKLMDRFNPQGQ